MGLRGPAPTPTEHLKARNSWRADANLNEPTPAVGAPDRPTGLTGVAGDIWGAMVGVVALGVLTRDNGQTLARYCHGLARWWKLAEWLDDNEDTYETVDKMGNTRHVRHPNVITYEKLSRDLVRLEQEFGLTPSSRTRIHVAMNPEKKTKPAGVPTLKIAT
jgi:P27 family predicted phage terminase small subunit